MNWGNTRVERNGGGNAHCFRLQPYERYISHGVCDCGAVRFFADSMDSDVLVKKKVARRVEFLNQKKGKEGKGHMVLEKSEPQTAILPHDVKSLPPVPPKPRKRKLLPKYWEANKPAILHDYQTMILRDFFQRWGISSSGWQKLKVLWKVEGKHKKAKPSTPNAPGKPKATVTKVDKGNQDKPPDIKLKKLISLGTFTVEEDKRLPNFPAFRWWWRKDVQIEWLKTYRELAGK